MHFLKEIPVHEMQKLRKEEEKWKKERRVEEGKKGGRRFLSYKPKTAFYPYVLFLGVAAILVSWPGHRTHFFN